MQSGNNPRPESNFIKISRDASSEESCDICKLMLYISCNVRIATCISALKWDSLIGISYHFLVSPFCRNDQKRSTGEVPGDVMNLWLACRAWCMFRYYRANSRFASSQWDTTLQSNAVSHWLGTSLKSALYSIHDMLTHSNSALMLKDEPFHFIFHDREIYLRSNINDLVR